MMNDILPMITKEGQPYLDKPVYALPKQESYDTLKMSVMAAWGRQPGDQPKPIIVRHDRKELQWMKPGPDGKLVPR